jgi:threonine synthase
VLLKSDHLNPTGSFKDRGVSLVISSLKSHFETSSGQPAFRLLEDSSGNGGSAFAAYAAAAGLPARVLVPEGTSPAKVLAVRAYGAQVQVVPGTRDDTLTEAMRQATEDGLVYASHIWSPLFAEGVKTQAYEIWEQLDHRVPELVVLVAGGASQVLGHDLAWHELLRAGVIDHLPRLLVVQPANCAPLIHAYHHSRPVGSHRSLSAPFGHSDGVGHEGIPQPTIAEGAAFAHPVRDREVLAAMYRFDALTAVASEAQIVVATKLLCSWGHYAEPTSATALAGYLAALDSGIITPTGPVVIPITGSGHKAAARMAEIFG